MRYTLKSIARIGGVALIAVFIAGYSAYQAQGLLKGPEITLSIPSDGRNDVAVVTGVAKNIAYLSFNDGQIYTDKDGNFGQKFVLSDGYNVIKVAATDKFGRTTEKTVELVYDAKSSSGTLSMITTDTHGKTN